VLTIAAIEDGASAAAQRWRWPATCGWPHACSTLYVPEIERGITVLGAVPRITHLVGPARAKRIAGAVERIPAATAEGWGLVDRLAERGEALVGRHAGVRQAASLPPVPLRMIKQAVNATAFALYRATSQADFDQFAR
jgi:enoyl-CoA hydratase/carnithine racemase